jgi:hypothetical protein
MVGAVISMKLARGPITQLFTRHIYHILINIPSLNCLVTVEDEAYNKLVFWKDLSRLTFESDIWPYSKGLSIKVATDAYGFGWGEHILGGIYNIDHEHFLERETIQSSTYCELLSVIRRLQSLIELGKAELVLVQVDALNTLGIIKKGSLKLALNTLAQELFLFCLSHKIVIFVEWVPREIHAFADEISK